MNTADHRHSASGRRPAAPEPAADPPPTLLDHMGGPMGFAAGAVALAGFAVTFGSVPAPVRRSTGRLVRSA